jgi:hypothetical protein
LLVLEDHKVFAEQPHRLYRSVAGKFVDQGGGLPIAPHQVARRRASSGPGDEIVLFRTQHRQPSPFVHWALWPNYARHASNEDLYDYQRLTGSRIGWRPVKEILLGIAGLPSLGSTKSIPASSG